VVRVNGETLPRLVEIMRRLLAEDGCPWDREQSPESLTPYVVEEAFEVVDAIDRGEPDALREELGDLLFQVVFLSELMSRSAGFDIDDVVAGVCAKMERRHPWVFGDMKMEDASAAIRGWEAMKAQERGQRGALDGVPAALPPLLRAVRVGDKAASVGYDWPDAGGARGKVDEELGELDQALAAGDDAAAERELGDLLFAVASFARKAGMDPSAALRGTLDRFSSRFAHAEHAALARGATLRELDADALDGLWEDAKRALAEG
jgi:MazG family protein